MKYFICVCVILLLNCKNTSHELTEDDIVSIVHKSNNIVDNITENYYSLDNRFKEPGKHSLMMTFSDIRSIKKKIIEEDIYNLEDSLKFVKTCKTSCLSEITILYRSGKRQHFIFDNYLYRNNINDVSYSKLTNLEELIAKIIMKKKIDPESINVYL